MKLIIHIMINHIILEKLKNFHFMQIELSLMSCVLFFFSVQINMMVSFREECQECPCPEDIQDLMWEFHQDLMSHCGKQPIRTTNAIILLPLTGIMTSYMHLFTSFYSV